VAYEETYLDAETYPGLQRSDVEEGSLYETMRRLWGLDLADSVLAEIAAELGSDVPFSLMGGTARGTGRGELLTPVLTQAELHWVVALIDAELSTPRVYSEWDRLLGEGRVQLAEAADALDVPLLSALRLGDARGIAAHLVNDLQPAALALRPSLGGVLDAGIELGALAGMVSGSGPTCVFLADGREAAIALAAEMAGTGLVRGVRHAVGPVPGARVVA
jgi:4-diphosphocytidyl-2-C-methyl-D-erythritol kinase